MSDLSEIKARVSAVSQTRQITNAMYLISASRMRRTIKKIEYNVKYMERIRATMKDVLLHTDSLSAYHYIRPRNVRRTVLYVVITGDKGMCGGYNAGVLSRLFDDCARFERAGVKVRFGVVGIVGEEYLKNKGITPDFVWRGAIQDPALFHARRIAADLLEEYDQKRVDEVYFVYTGYVSTAVQTPAVMRLLPIKIKDYSDVGVEYAYTTPMTFEPNPGKVFASLVPQYLIALIFNMLVQSSTGEYAARMNAMQTSTENADSMLDGLRREYNQRRQLDITNEITEIAATAATVSE